MAIIDVVKWDGDATQLAWKFDKSQELSTWTQLIVNESQEAVVYRGGAMDGPFGPGRHTLKTENLPVLAKMLSLPFGRSPFTAEVWFVNRAFALDVPWQTHDAIRLQDPLYQVIVPVVADGQYGVQIAHTRKFLVKLVGTMPDFTQAKLRDYLRGMILTIAKSTIAKEIVRKKVSVLEIATELVDLSAAIGRDLAMQLDDFGLKLINFFVSSINVEEGDESIARLQGALASRAEQNIMGYSYQQKRSLDVLATAAGNEGNGGAFMGAGMGLGAGVAMGGAMAQGFGAVAQQMNPNGGPGTGSVGGPGSSPNPSAPMPPVGPTAGAAQSCAKCGAGRANMSAKFCAECGEAYPVPQAKICLSCKNPLPPNAKFCSNCGAQASIESKCAGCGAMLTPGARFCGECGAIQSPAPIPQEC